jgi:hypothetical protein
VATGARGCAASRPRRAPPCGSGGSNERSPSRAFPISRAHAGDHPTTSSRRHVSRVGNICVNNDVVFVSTALAGEIIGLRQESVLRWRAHFFGVDLGSIEIVPLNDAFTSDPVTSLVSSVHPKRHARQRRIVNTVHTSKTTQKRGAVSA